MGKRRRPMKPKQSILGIILLLWILKKKKKRLIQPQTWLRKTLQKRERKRSLQKRRLMPHKLLMRMRVLPSSSMRIVQLVSNKSLPSVWDTILVRNLSVILLRKKIQLDLFNLIEDTTVVSTLSLQMALLRQHKSLTGTARSTLRDQKERLTKSHQSSL
jgi:hypothetical protein